MGATFILKQLHLAIQEKYNNTLQYLRCCHLITLFNSCSGAGYTSRWYHMSDGEHFCNACFDYMYRR